MGNRKAPDKPGSRTKPSGPDLRQLDLWAQQAASVGQTGARTDAKNPPQRTGKPGVVTRLEPDRSPRKPVRAPSAAARSPVPLSARRDPVSAQARSLPPLTRRQHTLLDYLRQREERGERPPSLTEICRDLGLVSRGSLHKQIVALVDARLVEPMNGKQRGVRLARAANEESRLKLLGAIAAGRPIEALTRDESVVIPGWLRTGGDCYALRVRGDSMRDAGILDGDIVVIEARESAKNGEMVVALIDDNDATLKRIEQRPGEVLLHAENPLYAPQRYAPDRVRIQGVVVGSLRRY
jgi:repressor LexA